MHHLNGTIQYSNENSAIVFSFVFNISALQEQQIDQYCNYQRQSSVFLGTLGLAGFTVIDILWQQLQNPDNLKNGPRIYKSAYLKVVKILYFFNF